MIAAVKDRMLEKRLNQTRLAEVTGITTRTISNFLTGKRMPHDLTLASISAALEWPPTALTELNRGVPLAQATLTEKVATVTTIRDPRISEATLTELAAELQRRLTGSIPTIAAPVAPTPTPEPEVVTEPELLGAAKSGNET